MTPLRTMAPMGLNRRVSPESAWPLRTADGRTFAERQQRRFTQIDALTGGDNAEG